MVVVPHSVDVHHQAHAIAERLAHLQGQSDGAFGIGKSLQLDQLEADAERLLRIVDEFFCGAGHQHEAKIDMVDRLAAEQLIDGNAQRLAFDIVKRRIHHRFGMMVVAHEDVHAADDLFDLGRVLADQYPWCDLGGDYPGDRVLGFSVVKRGCVTRIGNSDYSCVGKYLQYN